MGAGVSTPSESPEAMSHTNLAIAQVPDTRWMPFEPCGITTARKGKRSEKKEAAIP